MSSILSFILEGQYLTQSLTLRLGCNCYNFRKLHGIMRLRVELDREFSRTDLESDGARRRGKRANETGLSKPVALVARGIPLWCQHPLDRGLDFAIEFLDDISFHGCEQTHDIPLQLQTAIHCVIRHAFLIPLVPGRAHGIEPAWCLADC